MNFENQMQVCHLG